MSSIRARAKVSVTHAVFDPRHTREDFPIFFAHPSLSYLDSAATSQTPQVVLDAMHAYYTQYRSNIHRGMYTLGEETTRAYEEARRKTAEFIGAKPEEVIFTSGATASSNMLVRSIEESFDLKEGDEIVTSVMEHHGALIPLQKLAKRRKLVMKYIPVTDSLDFPYEEAERLITPRTKIVSVMIASNVVGTVNDIRRIARRAHAVGAIMLVDAAQAVGHIAVDVKALDADFLYFSGHKMLGPTGIGILYGRGELLRKLNPSVFGGGIVEKVGLTSATWKDIPARFEAGTQHIAGAIGLGAAIGYVERMGMQNIHRHVQELVRYALHELKSIQGARIFAQADVQKNIGIVSFSLGGIHPHDIAEIAGRSNVALRAGHHCAQPLMNALGVPATARASFYLYNAKSDIDALVNALREAKKIFSI